MDRKVKHDSSALHPKNRVGGWAVSLVDWFDQNGRSLPWREDNDPYHVWVSEIMLQQTRIETVIPYYLRFMERFPRVEDLAEANEEEVLKLWEGLGYYSRARNLQKAAKAVVALGAFPSTKEALKKLTGIGDYTAGAIAAIAFHEEVTAIDGNVMRVVSRLEAMEENVLLESSKKQVEILLKEGYPHGKASSFVQGLMELGETICLPKEPRCGLCPLQEVCIAHAQGKETQLPHREKEQNRTIEDRLVVILRDDQKRLMVFKRPLKGVLGGLYELPNILLSKESSLEELQKQLSAKYGIPIFLDRKTKEAKHVFSHITWNLTIYEGHTGPDAKEHFENEADIMLPTAFKKLL